MKLNKCQKITVAITLLILMLTGVYYLYNLQGYKSHHNKALEMVKLEKSSTRVAKILRESPLKPLSSYQETKIAQTHKHRLRPTIFSAIGVLISGLGIVIIVGIKK